LRRSLGELPEMTGPPAPVAGFHFNLQPADAHGRTRPYSLGLQNVYFRQVGSKHSVQASRLLGQTFISLPEVSAAVPIAASPRGATAPNPLLRPPDFAPLARSLALAGGGTMLAGALSPIRARYTNSRGTALPRGHR
jgi:hypothetical protein